MKERKLLMNAPPVLILLHILKFCQRTGDFFAVFASFKMMPRLTKKFLPKEYSDESGLKVQSHKVNKGKRNIDILGQIKNTGSETWQSVKVEAEYFDKQNTFVDTKSDYISGAGSFNGSALSCTLIFAARSCSVGI